MQNKKTFLQRFIKKQANISSATHTSPTKTDTQSCTWYQSISTLPLSRFITCAVDGNLSALIINGFPSETELQIAWNDIVGEFSDQIGDGESKLRLSLFKEINLLQITLEQIGVLVELLNEIYHEPFLVHLNKLLRTSYKLDPNNPEEYRKTLKAAIMRCGGIKIELGLKQARYKAMEEKPAEDFKYTRAHFQGILITLSDHVKYPIHDSITVYEYCDRIKRFNDYVRIQEKQFKR